MSSIKKTNSAQFHRLVELMKRDVDLAKGICGMTTNKRDLQKKWGEIAMELNYLGPPMRDAYEWKKVWIDTKARIKKIMADISAEAKDTEARSIKIRNLTPLHQEIIALLCMSNGANTSENYLESEDETTGEVKPCGDILENLMNGTVPFTDPLATVTGDPMEISQASHQPRMQSKTVDKRFALLKKQTTVQVKTLEQLSKIHKTTFEIAKSLHRLADAQERRNEILEEGLELKRRKLELKEKEMDWRVANMD